MSPQFFVALGIIVLLGIIITIGNRKKKWYKVSKATNGMERMLVVYRKQGDYFFGENIKDFVTAHYKDGTTIYIPKHWILLVERIEESKVNDTLLEAEEFNANQKLIEAN